jgi:hypothetical protein
MSRARRASYEPSQPSHPLSAACLICSLGSLCGCFGGADQGDRAASLGDNWSRALQAGSVIPVLVLSALVTCDDGVLLRTAVRARDEASFRRPHGSLHLAGECPVQTIARSGRAEPCVCGSHRPLPAASPWRCRYAEARAGAAAVNAACWSGGITAHLLSGSPSH